MSPPVCQHTKLIFSAPNDQKSLLLALSATTRICKAYGNGLHIRAALIGDARKADKIEVRLLPERSSVMAVEQEQSLPHTFSNTPISTRSRRVRSYQPGGIHADSRWNSVHYPYPAQSVRHPRCTRESYSASGWVSDDCGTAMGSYGPFTLDLESDELVNGDSQFEGTPNKMFEPRLSNNEFTAVDQPEGYRNILDDEENQDTMGQGAFGCASDCNCLDCRNHIDNGEDTEDVRPEDDARFQYTLQPQQSMEYMLDGLHISSSSLDRSSSLYASAGCSSWEEERAPLPLSSDPRAPACSRIPDNFEFGSQFLESEALTSDFGTLSVSESSRRSEGSLGGQAHSPYREISLTAERQPDVPTIESLQVERHQLLGHLQEIRANIQEIWRNGGSQDIGEFGIEQELGRLKAEEKCLLAQVSAIEDHIDANDPFNSDHPTFVADQSLQKTSKPPKPSSPPHSQARPPRNPKAASLDRANKALDNYNEKWTHMQRSSRAIPSGYEIPWPTAPQSQFFKSASPPQLQLWSSTTHRFFCRAFGIIPTSTGKLSDNNVDLGFKFPTADSKDAQVEKLKALEEQLKLEAVRWHDDQLKAVYGEEVVGDERVKAIWEAILSLNEMVHEELGRLESGLCLRGCEGVGTRFGDFFEPGRLAMGRNLDMEGSR